MQVILASQSPRRLELFRDVVPEFDVVVSAADETVAPGTPAAEAVKLLSLRKAQAVAAQYPCALVVGADTVVTLDAEILGKPHGADDARRMLRLLSGRTHEVLTGVSILAPCGGETFCVSTAVRFYELTAGEIDAYVATGEPFDKAGAYGIQGRGRLLVQGIEGDYYNVMGLPVAQLYRRLGPYLR